MGSLGPIVLVFSQLSPMNHFLLLEGHNMAYLLLFLGGHDFVVRGADLPAQTFHIPASVIHASEGSSLAEAGEGSVKFCLIQ